MNEDMEILIKLHDLDLLLKELTSPRVREQYKKIGFRVADPSLEVLKERDYLAKKLSKEYAEAYERIRKRYERALAPVIKGFCYGCFQKLPTQMVCNPKIIQYCPNCGRILYWVR